MHHPPKRSPDDKSSRRAGVRVKASIKASRWAAYATAGAATAFAGVNSAEADITYSGPLNQPFNAAPQASVLATFTLDQPGDYFGLQHIRRNANNPGNGSALFAIYGLTSAAFAGFTSVFNSELYGNASKLASGQNISTRPFVAGNGFLPAYLAAGNGFGVEGGGSQWLAAGTGFLGFRSMVAAGCNTAGRASRWMARRGTVLRWWTTRLEASARG